MSEASERIRAAIARGRAVVDTVVKVAEEIRADPTLSDAGRAEKVAAAIDQARRELATALQGAGVAADRLAEVRARIEKKIKPTDPADATLLAAAASTLRDMSDEERRTVVTEALKNGDLEVLRPTGMLPAWMTKLGDARGRCREALIAKVDPDGARELADLQTAAQEAGTARAILTRELDLLQQNRRMDPAEKLRHAREGAGSFGLI